MHFRTIILAAAILSAAGCGERAVDPGPQTIKTTAPRDQAFDLVMAKLAGDGFAIASSDRQTGIISTAPKVVKLTNADADCPGSFGVNLTEEPRTVLHLTWNVTVAEHSVTVRPSIEYAYLPGDSHTGRSGPGTTTGKLERELAARLALP